jgi:hypothetical protein
VANETEVGLMDMPVMWKGVVPTTTFVDPDLVASAKLVAVIVTVFGLGGLLGAV